MRFHIAISTCERPVRLTRLLDAIRAQNGGHTVDLFLYDDATRGDVVTDGRKLRGVTMRRFGRRLGKREYWRLFDTVLQDIGARVEPYDCAMFFQDDVHFPPTLFDDVASLVRCLSGVSYAAINLYGDRGDRTRARWTGRKIEDGPCGLYDASWLDMQSFVMHRSFIEDVPYMVPVPPDRWDDDPALSSGVGRQISRRLVWGRERTLFMVRQPWVVHDDDGESKMNPDRKADNPYPDAIT